MRMKPLLLVSLFFILLANPYNAATKPQSDTPITDTIYVDIWSDISCPYCYIGKKRLEQAIALFRSPHTFVLTWRSFQLDASIVSSGTEALTDYLSARKGMSADQTSQLLGQVADMAHTEGLSMEMQKVVVANTLRAHCLLAMAADKKVQSVVQNALFKAYFEEGKNINDVTVLTDIATDAGIHAAEAEEALKEERFLRKVQEDFARAEKIGISSVPFFVFNRQFAISGAQETEVFLRFLQEKFGK